MKTKIKKQWVEALRSGKYVQGRNVLRTNDDRYCCLGVLCDLHSKATHSQWCMYGNQYHYINARFVLPQAVMDWAGLDVHTNIVEVIPSAKKAKTTLANLNDHGRSFARIANIIEKQL